MRNAHPLAAAGGGCRREPGHERLPERQPGRRADRRGAQEAGAYVVTQWNKPADLHPWDHDPNYVAHISFSGVPYGKAMAEALIKAMGGKGGIVALRASSNVPAIERKAGLEQALAANPDVKLLDFQVANWSAHRGAREDQRWLTQYGDEIGGIWAANDDMALGAVEALRADGRAGKVPVTGIDGIQLAVEAILDGEMAGTVAWDPSWQGGMGLSIGYHAKTGKFDPATGAQGPPRVLRPGVLITAGERRGVLRRQHQDRARARLGRHLGPRSGQGPADVTRDIRPPRHARRQRRSRPSALGGGVRFRDAGPPVALLVLLCAGRLAAINPNFLSFGNVRHLTAGGDDPVVGLRRHLHHPDGLDRPLGRGRAWRVRVAVLAAGAQRRQRQRLRPARDPGRGAAGRGDRLPQRR